MKNERGVIVVAVLWVCSLIMWFAMQIGTETRLQGEEQIHLLRKSQAMHLAIGGCYEALARLGQPLPTGLERKQEDNWQPDGRPHLIEYGTGEAVVLIEAESRKLNVNLAQPEQLKRALSKAGLDDGMAEQLADVIADFADKDDLTRLHGAEKDRYAQLGLPYGPFNGPLISLDQLLLVPGVSSQLFYGHGREGASDEEEQTEFPLDPLFPRRNSLFHLLTVHGNNRTIADEELGNELEEKIVTWESGGVYRILSLGRTLAGPPPILLWLTIRFTPGGDRGYQVLHRKIL
ncbi:MAG: general secretion pathway protein GspK [Syntrophobacteraceae bacterium]